VNKILKKGISTDSFLPNWLNAEIAEVKILEGWLSIEFEEDEDMNVKF
jgi:hypothetical protein